MLQIFKTTTSGLQEVKSFEKDSWINVENPTREEIEKLSNELKIPLDFLTYPLDVNERARTEIDEKCAMIILRIPSFNENDVNIPFITLPIGILFMEDFIITICSKRSEVIANFSEGKVKNFSTAKRTRFILQIFLVAALSYLKYLKEINDISTAIESALHKAMKNEELIKLLNLEKSLVYFTTSLRSNDIMIERLQRQEISKMEPYEKDLIEDVLIENKQAIEMANIYSNILSGTMDAFATVISNNLNVVMKFLTVVTIILMLPNLVASIYGMNVRLPLQDHPHAFLLTIIFSLILSGVVILFFIKRKMF